jgi:hypothetical protein
MVSRNKRGIRRASVRVRLAVAATVIAVGGAAGVVAVVATHNGTLAAQSAGYTTSHRQPLSETQALSSAMNGWNKSPSKSLATLAQMTPMPTFNTMPWHTHTIALQRGTVLAAAKDAFVIKSSNRQVELWFVNRGTKILNVGSSQTGMRAMTGGTMSMPGNMKMNMKTKTLAKGDLVFIFGERVHGELVAQLVLFVAPVKVTPRATATPSMTATPSWTATPSMTATPSRPATPAVPAIQGANGTPTAVGTHS